MKRKKIEKQAKQKKRTYLGMLFVLKLLLWWRGQTPLSVLTQRTNLLCCVGEFLLLSVRHRLRLLRAVVFAQRVHRVFELGVGAVNVAGFGSGDGGDVVLSLDLVVERLEPLPQLVGVFLVVVDGLRRQVFDSDGRAGSQRSKKHYRNEQFPCVWHFWRCCSGWLVVVFTPCRFLVWLKKEQENWKGDFILFLSFFYANYFSRSSPFLFLLSSKLRWWRRQQCMMKKRSSASVLTTWKVCGHLKLRLHPFTVFPLLLDSRKAEILPVKFVHRHH